MTTPITKPNVLLVEGKDEELFFEALASHLGLLQDIQIKDIAGKTKLRPNLKALVSTSGFTQVTSLGVVRDADGDPSAAFQSVHDALQAVGLHAPNRPLARSGARPEVTVMIMPGEGAPGMLEDLCLRAVGPDPAMPCVERYFECLQEQDLCFPQNLSKAKVQTFLASRPEAGKRLGEAAQAGYWPWNDEAFAQVRDFLRQLVL